MRTSSSMIRLINVFRIYFILFLCLFIANFSTLINTKIKKKSPQNFLKMLFCIYPLRCHVTQTIDLLCHLTQEYSFKTLEVFFDNLEFIF